MWMLLGAISLALVVGLVISFGILLGVAAVLFWRLALAFAGADRPLARKVAILAGGIVATLGLASFVAYRLADAAIAQAWR